MSDCAHENMQLSMRDTRLFCDDCGRLWVSEDCVTEMRERAAKWVEEHLTTPDRDRRWLAAGIRALPIDPETGGE